ncbi:D-2-hydroxyacid dehydrogenase [uncultured Bifidobacterium sp.]|uniref:D-2-hydroxyacid dehydrogenase n=1 Tax=uncultured Bifidobacterium sp. TaxID=165187 RepID=UPI0028DC3488|nr:D-2-hydroxyacid dehydrogenase [uncultured Bifidobacterium sp.]
MTHEGAPATGGLIVNCLPLTEEERRRFRQAAPEMVQEFTGDDAHRGDMVWPVTVPESLRPLAAAVIGNVDPDTLADYARLQWLQTFSAGADPYLSSPDLAPEVAVCNAAGVYGRPVAEMMIAMMWTLMKRIPDYVRNQSAGAWRDEGSVSSPAGRRALVIGTGDIGSHVAVLARSAGMATTGVRRDPRRSADGVDEMAGFDRLDDLLPRADVVFLAVPSAPGTRHLMDARRLALLKPGVYVINGGRGDAVDCLALAAALHGGRLAGAGLDVTEPEPLPEGHPLWREPRCLITPHVGGGNHLAGTGEAVIAVALDNLRRYAEGRPLLHRLGRDHR